MFIELFRLWAWSPGTLTMLTSFLCLQIILTLHWYLLSVPKLLYLHILLDFIILSTGGGLSDLYRVGDYLTLIGWGII